MRNVLSWSSRAARRVALLALAAVSIVVLAPVGQARAQWPEKPVKIILPFGAGGVADVSSRILADKVGQKLGQRVVIENMPGAGGISAARAVTSARPDGYTLGLVTNGTAISVAAFKHLPFDPVTQFAMISELGQFNLLFAVAANSKYKTLQDFIKDAKANPGKLNIGTVVAGSTQNLGAELFRSKAGLNVQLVTYRGSPDAVVSLLRNDIQLLVEFPPAIAGQVASHKLRVLASTGPAREGSMPDVPTIEQVGVKGYVVTSWNGVFAPKGTPQDVIDTMGKAMREVLAEKDVQQRFAKLGVEAHASTPAELMTKLTDDIKKWNDVIEKAGIPKK
ncbi:MAG TPA: tripartite tricarboxylate transporter substrate binding protein [Pseudolabrys sp.]|jgi:tripartite-type tricarboxylate transporter receptor subunit TctC|nr:tripartite tricarboxylate transporter substrate binding protein [Pseudolabrys sp.]